MSSEIHLHHLWYKISAVEFGFYQPQQIRNASVKEITNPIAFDTNKNPNVNGLYDPCMGVSPNDRTAICVTCGHAGLQCSGHIAHIQLLLPVYNPLVIDRLLQLLKLKCFDCHRLRMRETVIEQYTMVFLLIKKGLLKQAIQYRQLKNKKAQRNLQKLSKLEKSQKTPSDRFQQKLLKKALESMKLTKYKIQKAAQYILKKDEVHTNAANALFNQILKEFYQQSNQKCPHCLKNYKGIKKQGASKIFLIKSDKKQKQTRKKSSSTTKGESMVQSAEETNEQKKQKKKQLYINPRQIYYQLKQLWRKQHKLLELIFGNGQTMNSFNMFFLYTIIVPPNRFRPESKLGQQKYLHDHTIILTKIIKINNELKTLIINESLDPGLNQKLKKTKFNQKNLSMSEIKTTEWFSDALKKIKNKTQFINKWLQLQDSVNCFLDATKSSKVADRDFKGIRQILEKKQGLFRMKMMGKRVNYAARSVISPDPSLQTDQVGLPVFMAKKLSFPQSVNQYNSERLKQYIVNGNQYPGASYIQQNGRLIKLDVLSEQQRISHARNLLVNAQNKVVYRHIMTGDNVLFNRQPTLHKPGLMAHRVRVLPKEQTLRMNYANCKSYNADFDGDQMNLHALQNYPAKAQAELCITDRIYTNPTNGKPIRQLIQDSIISAVYLTLKDTFLTKSEYSELLYQSTFSLFAKKPKNCRIFILPPTIIKPKQLWTGKQLISNIMKLIVSLSDHKFKNQKGLVMSVKSKMSVNYLKPGAEDEVNILVVDNQLLRGILVKDQIGSNSDYGLIHSFNELYGYQLTGQFLTCLTKLFTCYLQMHGFTCGLDDLILKKQVQTNRRNLINHAHNFTVQSIGKFLGLNQIPQNIDYVERSLYECDQQGNYKKNKKQQHYLTQNDEIVKRLAKKMQQPNGIAQVDGEYKELLFKKSSTVNNECLNGFLKRFPHNNFSMMTVTGAKGSNVNHSQVSSLLGQQQLQGKRVPMMINGKTLPCFLPYDPNPRAYGYISDRFFSGLRYQQFYFHCMAGRQGLIDTAVKTSRSGYLQRCLMKHLQSLKIQYDMTVRDADAGIIEFLYGEDSIDITKEKFLSKFQFLNKNKNPFTLKYQHNFFKDKLNLQEIRQFKSDVISQKQTIMNRFPVGKNIASISQKAYQSLKKYSKNLPINQQRHFQELYHLKYLNTLAHPGQSVGCTAAQAIGQPSTQLTLNTFHLAGHGGANLTLGIPRLRQILMTSTDKLKTPIMELYFSNGVTKQQANFYAKQLQKIKLIQLIKQIQVEEYKKLFEDEKILAPDDRKRIYNIKISYEDLRLIKQQFGITIQQIQQKINNVFIPLLLNHISRVLKKNQMKTQIKRTNVKNQKQEQLQDRDDSDIQQNEETKNKELKKQENQEEDINRYDSPFFDSKLFEEDHCKIKVKVPLNLKKFLMTKVIERLLKNVILRQIKDINNAVVLLKDNDDIKTIYIQTQGVNFKAISTLQFINKNSIYSNDIQAIYRTFGIEAARKSIIKQIVSVFGAYGVGVDYRHLYLIADYMTFPGAIKAMNRNWINENVSPFLKMSFETSVNFLTSAASFRQVDRCTTPSSQIVLGLNPTIGTGVFDLLMDLKFRK